MAPSYDTVILNGTVVTASDVRSVRAHSRPHSPQLTLLRRSVCDIGIKDGRIAALTTSFSQEEIASAKVIDAEYVSHLRLVSNPPAEPMRAEELT
jgi:N-acyl-D-aspartate/D-glutamate deacylase